MEAITTGTSYELEAEWKEIIPIIYCTINHWQQIGTSQVSVSGHAKRWIHKYSKLRPGSNFVDEEMCYNKSNRYKETVDFNRSHSKLCDFAAKKHITLWYTKTIAQTKSPHDFIYEMISNEESDFSLNSLFLFIYYYLSNGKSFIRLQKYLFVYSIVAHCHLFYQRRKKSNIK